MPRRLRPGSVRAATLADVGRAAGVSAMAASAVLNHAQTSSRISEETRVRIVAAAERLHYRPNATARALAKRRMNTIGVAAILGEGELSGYGVELLSGILGTATRHEQNVTMFTVHDCSRDTARLHDWCDGRIDGMILIAPTLTREEAAALPAHTPFVSIHSNVPLRGILDIGSDEERGAYEAVRHLLSQGHKRIMHISGKRRLMGPERRIRGYKRALADAGISFSPGLFLPSSYEVGHGLETMRGWLRSHAGRPLPQAIFCANDAIAIGCVEALAEVGLRVPEDVSVTGFDDTLVARTTVPQLTTVRQPLRAMGGKAAEVLLKVIGQRGGGAAPEEPNPILFPVELVARASVAAPPATARLVPLEQPQVQAAGAVGVKGSEVSNWFAKRRTVS
jgi:LacI family transcriptional regulator